MIGTLLWILIASAAVTVITITVAVVISRGELKKQLTLQCPDFFTAKLEAKKKNAVRVKVYNHSGSEIADVEITSNLGVSNDLKVGELIYS